MNDESYYETFQRYAWSGEIARWLLCLVLTEFFAQVRIEEERPVSPSTRLARLRLRYPPTPVEMAVRNTADRTNMYVSRLFREKRITHEEMERLYITAPQERIRW